MKVNTLIFILCLILLVIAGCDRVAPTSYTPEKIPCQKGLMRSAFNEYQSTDQSVPNISDLRNDFVVLVDPKLKTTNFISWTEGYLRDKSVNIDTAIYYSWKDGWTSKTKQQKLVLIEAEKADNKRLADSIHVANQGKPQVWLINNSDKAIDLQLQDWSVIAVLEALTKDKEWKPVQFWRFSTCGNSYINKHLLPKTANSFIALGINSGDYKTKLRYKLLGRTKFYYSNEFDGSINYCEFGEDTTSHRSHYKLDVFKDLIIKDRRLNE